MNRVIESHSGSDVSAGDDDEVSFRSLLQPLVKRWLLMVLGPLLAGMLTLGITYLIKPTFTARTSLLPPQQPQSSAGSTLASLGALSSLAGTAGVIKTPGDQYVSLLQSRTVADRLIDQFKLMDVYDEKLRTDARTQLGKRSAIVLGRKDGLITVEVEDVSPQRAADIANGYVEELRRLSGDLAITEAQQRRSFFEVQLKATREKLNAAQVALQGSGFSIGTLRAEPRAAAEGYARLQAEATAAEVRLATLQRSLADSTAEVQQQRTLLSALRTQLARVEQPTEPTTRPDYVGKYREFKYQEALFESFSRQFELARLDESREGALIQVLDPALPPEKKSRPRRGLTVVVAVVLTLFVLAIWVLASSTTRRDPTPESFGGA